MTHSGGLNSHKRMVSLDVLRGVAILMVLLVHAPWPDWVWQSFGGRLLRVGSHGVDLFFVLSGFLISRLLFTEMERTDGIRLMRFWMRRGFKIWPSYYVAYLSAVIMSWLWGQYNQIVTEANVSHWWHSWPNFVFLQNYVHPEARWFASWSLAIEEHFYTVLPLLFLLRSRLLAKSLGAILLAICLLVPVLRYQNGDAAAIYIRTHLRMDALCFGVLLGYCQSINVFWPFQLVDRFRFGALLLTVTSLSIPVLLPLEHWFMQSVGFTLLAICSSLWTAHAVSHPDWSANCRYWMRQGIRLVSQIGVYSYTIYLVQYLVSVLIDISKQLAVTSWFMNSHGPQLLAFWGGCLGLGWFLSTVVERPCLLLRERIVPK
jgi:peptidoglycan/LPS O-acetylase OafA/YrhL